MEKLNQIEIQNIRHICGHSATFCKKLNYFNSLTQDQNIIEVLDSICTECTDIKNELSSML